MTDNLAELTEKIIKAVPEIRTMVEVPTLCAIHTNCRLDCDRRSFKRCVQERPITLEDVLLAVGKVHGNGSIGIRFDDGRFICFHKAGGGWNYPDTDGEFPKWIQGDLSRQSPETIQFLNNLL